MRLFPYQIKSVPEYEQAYKESLQNPTTFWDAIAHTFTWIKKWDTVVTSNFKNGENTWFDGAILNITENCLDRHLSTQPHATALIWEPNNPADTAVSYTYFELHQLVCELGHVLLKMGVQKGDCVCIYMPMIPQLSIAMLACARIGAIHSVVFGGFSAQSIADRIIDANCVFIITADSANRGPKHIPIKDTVDQALKLCNSIKKVLVYEHTKTSINMQLNRDFSWQQEVQNIRNLGLKNLPATPMQAEDVLFILYTSGSTGKPKGVVHTCAGYMVWATYTFVNVFQYQPGWVHFCTADAGWITGHSYGIYGPLAAGACTLLFEGVPNYPTPYRFWEICEKHAVNIFYTAPTAIRSLMACDTEPIAAFNLSSLKVLGSVGEPINEEAWNWYNTHIGKNQCPIVDTWWQTETGGILISNLAGITPSKPTFATLPLPGINAQLVDSEGHILKNPKASGNLVIKGSWPGIIRTTFNDHTRCVDTYFSIYPNYFYTGDGCLRDELGNLRITGRVDDVLNVSGHRLGTAEIENAINSNKIAIESAVVGYPHAVKGIGIYAFIIVNSMPAQVENAKLLILETVTNLIGAIAKPDKIQFVTALPKTRSGKIMRRILRKIAEGDFANFGDTSSLLDPLVVDELIKGRIGL